VTGLAGHPLVPGTRHSPLLTMPQGGPGNCGGNLNGSGGSKRKMGGKQKHVTTKVWHAEAPRNGRRGAAGEAAAANASAAAAAGEPFEVHAPRAENRAAVLRAQEDLAVRSSRPVEGTVPGGEVLGGAAGLSENAREARLRYFVQDREEERAAARTSRRPATAERHYGGEVDTLAVARRAVRELLSSGDGVDCTVAHLLDMLAVRVGNAELQKAYTLLCRVLSNAEAKGGDDPKYLLLKSRNDTLWHGLLQHPECVGVLELGGFAVVDAATPAAAACDDATMDEISELQVALQQQLEAPQPNHTVVETLMLRLEQVSVKAAPPPASSHSAGCAHRGQGVDQWAKRRFDLRHLGGEAAQALQEVSHAAAQWECGPGGEATVNVEADASHRHDSSSKESE
jgi:hypothetical protein